MRMFADDDHRAPTFAVSATCCTERHDETEACRYQVAWQINPHMQPGAVDPVGAQSQHTAFVKALKDLGAQLLPVPFVHGAFDSVFTKDAAILTEHRGVRLALLSRFEGTERRREEVARGRHYEQQGFSVIDAPPLPLEGGDVVRLSDGTVLLGFGQRSSRAAAPVLESFMAQEVLPLELVDPWLYHLDTALTALDDGTVLCCREAFTSQGLQQLERHPAVKELLFVPRAEACRFALNVVQVGRTVLSGTLKAPVLNRLLERRGFRVCVVDLSQFHLAGGSAACLVSEVHREGAARRPSRSSRWAGSA